jgi:hypothetical protein
MSRRAALSSASRNRRSQRDPAEVEVRDVAAWRAWVWVCTRQMARMPAGRLVMGYVAFEVVPVLSAHERTMG